MSTFPGRRGPNVTQYLRSLDTEEDPQSTGQEDIDFGMFTNTQFFDFESGQTTDFEPPTVKPAVEPPSTASPTDLTAATSTDLLFTDFNFDFSQFPITPELASFSESLGSISTEPFTVSDFATTTPSQTSPSSTDPRIGDKRKADESFEEDSHVGPEDASRVAAEEDKRRRNTAASARFRHKKKQREQEMERKAKDSEEKITKLENNIQTLLAENKWLKNMILEKSGGSDDVGKKLDELSAKIQEAAEKKRSETLAAKEAKSATISKAADGQGVKEEKS